MRAYKIENPDACPQLFRKEIGSRVIQNSRFRIGINRTFSASHGAEMKNGYVREFFQQADSSALYIFNGKLAALHHKAGSHRLVPLAHGGRPAIIKLERFAIMNWEKVRSDINTATASSKPGRDNIMGQRDATSDPKTGGRTIAIAALPVTISRPARPAGSGASARRKARRARRPPACRACGPRAPRTPRRRRR